MDELEKQLTLFGGRKSVLHCSEDDINTWTKSFAFTRMTSKYKYHFLIMLGLALLDVTTHKAKWWKKSVLGHVDLEHCKAKENSKFKEI